MSKTPLYLWMTTALAALITLTVIFTAPSSAEKAWLLGLSAQRLALALIPFAGLLLGALMSALYLFQPARYARFAAPLRNLSDEKAFDSGSTAFWYALFMGAFVLTYRFALPAQLKMSDELAVWFPNLCAYLDRLLPVLAFSAFCAAVWAFYRFPGSKRSPLENAGRFAFHGAAFLAAFAVLFQWLVLIFHLRIFEWIPGWYWPIMPKENFPARAGVYAVFFLAVIFLYWIMRRFPGKTWLNLLLISAVFVGLQIAVGFMDGRGMASLTDRFFLSYHRVYVEEACAARVSPAEAIRRYDEFYPLIFFQTKPPGVLWFSFILNNIANAPVISGLLDNLSQAFTLSAPIPRLASIACQRSMTLVTLLFPLLSAAAVWALCLFAKLLSAKRDHPQAAYYGGLLFVLAPNAVMLTLFPDQALYPALFTLSACAILHFMQKKSPAACFLLGLVIYGVNFLSFSMLPLLAVPLIYFALAQWQEKSLAAIKTAFLRELLPMGLGGLAAYGLFRLLLGYDVITRYQRMMAARIEGDFYVRFGIEYIANPTFLEKIRQTFDAAVLNNIELAASVGFPVFIFFVMMGLRSLAAVIQRKAGADLLAYASLFLTYVSLNVIRAVMGEASRLWIFWVPTMAYMAVVFLLPELRRSRWGMLALLLVQLTTLFLTYHNQDLRMPQLIF